MLTPEEISSRQFLISLRGYDRDEVQDFLDQVAEEVGALQGRIRELEQQLGDAGTGSSYAPASTQSAVPARRDSGEGSRHAFQALGEETTRILVAAEESAQEIRRRAEDRARHDVEQARREAREEVSGARRTASKIVADAERRRNGIAEDIRQLEAARDDLMNDLRTVMQSVQSAVRGLASTSDNTGLAAGDQIEVEGPGPALAAGASAQGMPEPASGEAEEDLATEVAHAAEGTRTVATDEARTLENVKRAVAPDGPEDDDDVVADLTHVDPDSTTEAALEEDRDDVDAMASAVAAAPDTTEIDVEDAVAIANGEADVSDEDGQPADAGSGVEEGEELGEAPPDSAAAVDVTEDEDAIQLRMDSLGGIRPGMLRRLKRALQDVQNGVLDAIRRQEGDGQVDDLLPDDGELAPLIEVGSMFFAAAYRAGIADGAVLVDEEVPEGAGDAARVTALATTFQAVLSHEIRASLTATLRAGLEAGEPETSLSERVGGVFRDLKGPVLEGAVDEHLTRVYGYGAIDLWKEVDAADSKRWVVGEEPRCPANQCRTNAAEGAVGLGDEFPSGDKVPPAHDACTCAVVPA